MSLVMTDRAALTAAVALIGGTIAFDQTAQMFERDRVTRKPQSYTGTVITLPGWKFPVVITADNVAHYDTYGGAWGNMQHFTKLKGTYAEVVAKKRMLLEGRTVVKRVEANGWTRVEFQ